MKMRELRQAAISAFVEMILEVEVIGNFPGKNQRRGQEKGQGQATPPLVRCRYELFAETSDPAKHFDIINRANIADFTGKFPVRVARQ